MDRTSTCYNGEIVPSEPLKTSTLLKQSRGGDRVAAAELLPIVYEELRRLAAGYMRQQRREHTLQPTALVHEAYVKLIHEADTDWNDRGHFMAVAARAMRQVLVDYARRRGARKRGGDAVRVTLSALPAGCGSQELDLVEIEELLEHLGELDERKSRVVELRFFGGLTNEEIARVLEVSLRTVEGDWYVARAWLRRELTRSDG